MRRYNEMKKILAILFAMILAVGLLTACGGSTGSNQTTDSEENTEAVAETTEEAVVAEDEEEPDTGDASKDDPLNQDGIGEKEILVVSFGTSYNDNRVATIGGIEKAIAAAYPDWAVRRAFTAQIVIDHINDRDGEVIDNVEQALSRARENGVKELVVAPTHLMSGNEYDELSATLAKYNADFEKIAVSKPLLTSDEDKTAVAKELIELTKEYDDGETAIVFMGHGTDHAANSVYTEMQDVLRANGDDNYFVGVVHDGAQPDVNAVLAEVQKGDYKKVVLRDMMVVAGDHANNDMSDPEDPESWYSIFTNAGYETTTVLDGLGQVPAIQQIYVDHVAEAVDEISK
jgi:sirohydrochlorin cobaltochelatase